MNYNRAKLKKREFEGWNNKDKINKSYKIQYILSKEVYIIKTKKGKVEMNIKDRIALGTISGLLASIPSFVINFILVQIGFARWYSFQIGGSIYLHPENTNTLQGFIFGTLVWLIPASALGIIIAYVIRNTGEDFWWLKGIIITMVLMFLFTYGFLYTLGGATIVPFDFATNISVFIENVVFGLTASYLVKSWGKVKVM